MLSAAAFLMVSIMDTSPFALVGERFSLRPIFSMKEKSSPAISEGVLPEYTLMSREMMPLVMMASLSALK